MPLDDRPLDLSNRFLWVPRLDTRKLLVCLVFLTVFLMNVFGHTDPDFWWHLRTGQYITDTRTIPGVDLFSYTFEGEPRVAQEWASEALISLLFAGFGYAGDVLVFASIVTLTFFLVYRLCLKLGTNDRAAAVVVFWAAMLARPSFTVRPQVFTWLFFSIFLASLYLYHRGQTRWLWHLPVLMVLWVNLHGGFAIGLGLIALLLLARLGEALVAKKPLALGHPLAVLGISLAATLVNPNGFSGLSYPLSYAGFANPSARFITEWQSPNFHESYWLLLLASLLLFMAIGVSHRGLGAWPVMLIGVLAGMALQSARFIALYGLAMAPVLGETLKARFKLGRAADRRAPTRILGHVNWLLLLLSIVGAIGLAVRSPNSQLKELPLPLGEFTYPAAGAEYVRVNYPEARMFNEYAWGGYLIYSLFPTQRVFVDGRADLYGPELLNDYKNVVYLSPHWEEVLDRYGVDLVFIGKNSPLSVLLAGSPAWERVFTGEIEDIFVRNPR